MQKHETAIVNQHALAEFLRDKQLKQWWVARQIGVTPLTVNRWLTGKVRRISTDNLVRLARLLEVPESSLVLADEADVRATQVEQSQAARLLVNKETQSLFVNKGQFESYERLLKAVMHPNLPLRDLVIIYSSLTMAAAEQGRFEQARQYGRVRLDLALRAGDEAHELEARMNLITIDGASGQLQACRKGTEELIELAGKLPFFRGFGLALMNLHYILYLQAELNKAAQILQQAVGYMNANHWLLIKDSFYMQAALAALESGDLDFAERFRRLSLAAKANTMSPDKRLLLVLLEHVIVSQQGGAVDSARLDSVLAEFSAAEQAEETGLYLPALLLRRLGRLEEAESFFQDVSKRKLARVYDAPFLLAEQARLARARGQKAISKRLADKAAESFASLGMQRRSESDLLAEPGSQFKLAPRQRRILRELLASEEAQLAGSESAG